MYFYGFWHLYNEILTSLITLLDNLRYPYHPFTVSENSKMSKSENFLCFAFSETWRHLGIAQPI